MKTIIIDNFDSFTYNLYQYAGELGGNPKVFRNNEVALEDVRNMKPTHIIISPGACDPSDEKYFGLSKNIILELGPRVPLLGVCLGHQGIIYSFGGNIIKAPEIMHGKTSLIQHDGRGVFEGLPNPFHGMRYHSLMGDAKTLPECLEVAAWTSSDRARKPGLKFDPMNDIIMGVRHKEFKMHGIQFHPESIVSEEGKKILKNFLEC